MHKIRVGVLRGGPSHLFEHSLSTGSNILNNLSRDKYEIKDIFIDKDGTWHINGLSRKPNEILSGIDIALNASHGHYGEDGKLQHILEIHKIPFTGSSSFSSVLGLNKVLSKEIFERNNIKTPSYVVFESEKDAIQESVPLVLNKFPLPMIVKPATGGSRIGVSIIKKINELIPAIKEAFKFSDMVIVEEYINGIETSVCLIDWYRDETLYSLPPVEMGLEIRIPANISHEDKINIMNIARKVHSSLGFEHYSKTDFILSPRRGLFVLESNSHPSLAPDSIFVKSLNSVGSNLPHFLDHIIALSQKTRKY